MRCFASLIKCVLSENDNCRAVHAGHFFFKYPHNITMSITAGTLHELLSLPQRCKSVKLYSPQTQLSTHVHRWGQSSVWRNTAILPTTEHAQKTPDSDHEPNRRTIVLLKPWHHPSRSADLDAARRWQQTTTACTGYTGWQAAFRRSLSLLSECCLLDCIDDVGHFWRRHTLILLHVIAIPYRLYKGSC